MFNLYTFLYGNSGYVVEPDNPRLRFDERGEMLEKAAELPRDDYENDKEPAIFTELDRERFIETVESPTDNEAGGSL